MNLSDYIYHFGVISPQCFHSQFSLLIVDVDPHSKPITRRHQKPKLNLFRDRYAVMSFNRELNTKTVMHYKCCECVITIRSGWREERKAQRWLGRNRSGQQHHQNWINPKKIMIGIRLRFHDLTRPNTRKWTLNTKEKKLSMLRYSFRTWQINF